MRKCTRAAHWEWGCLFCSFELVGVCKILGVSKKSAGWCLEYLGSGVDIRLCNLRLCSETLGEEETLELEYGGKEGPVAPQASRMATEGSLGERRNFLGLGKQTRPFFGRAYGVLTFLVSFMSQRKPVLACSPQQGWRIFF